MTDAGYRALTRRIIFRRMQRRKAFRQAQLEQLKLRPLNNMRKRIGRSYTVLMTPLEIAMSRLTRLITPLFKGTTR